MTKEQWVRILGYSSYEINQEGVVRIAIDAPIAEERGELMRLDRFVPDKSKPDEVEETYKLISDTEGLRVIGKGDLLARAFDRHDLARWYPFPGRPGYEFSSGGQIRTINGELLPLETLENSDVRFYKLKSTKGDYYNHYTPSDILNDYLPFYEGT